MLATPGTLPADDAAWAYEWKWDGFRALVGWDGRRLRVTSRNGNDLTPRFPELADLPQALPGPTLLDGELVAFDAEGRPSFQLLQNRFPDLPGAGDGGTGSAFRYVAFDCLWRGGLLLKRPYTERRERLAALRLEGEHWTAPGHRFGGGAALLAAARAHGIEGVVAKRPASSYLPGRRSADWIKVKVLLRDDFVIGGFSIGKEADAFAGLLLGWHAAAGAPLTYAGLVGTGFTVVQRRALRLRLEGMRVRTSPFTGPVDRPDPRWVRPELVAEVAYSGITRDGRIRHPSFQGLRRDKLAAEVGPPAGLA